MYYPESAAVASGVDSLFVATALRATSKALDLFNHITFLYDPNWVVDPNRNTLPFAFLHNVTVQESVHNTVSQKRVVVYTDNAITDTAKQLAKMSVAADNIINDPVHYTMEAICPASGYSTLFQGVTNSYEVLTEALANQSWDGDTSAYAALNQERLVITNVASVIDAIISVLTSMNASTQIKTYLKGALESTVSALGINGNFFDALNSPTNKNSLMQMAASRHILTMKHWESWDYKYVVFNDCKADKSGENGDNYMVNIDVQEYPVMVIYNAAGNVSYKSKWFDTVQTSVKAFADEIISDLGVAGSAGL